MRARRAARLGAAPKTGSLAGAASQSSGWPPRPSSASFHTAQSSRLAAPLSWRRKLAGASQPRASSLGLRKVTAGKGMAGSQGSSAWPVAGAASQGGGA